MLKQALGAEYKISLDQPPSGGCVLKLKRKPISNNTLSQPPSGGCVLKHLVKSVHFYTPTQPPSGGCVLKLRWECANGKI